MGQTQSDLETYAKTRFGGGYYLGGFPSLGDQSSAYCTNASIIDGGFNVAASTAIFNPLGSLASGATLLGATIETGKCSLLAKNGYRVVPNFLLGDSIGPQSYQNVLLYNEDTQRKIFPVQISSIENKNTVESLLQDTRQLTPFGVSFKH